MKTVITSQGNSKESLFDTRFGRAAWFCIYNENSRDTEFKENIYAQAQGGAGRQAAEMMASLGVTKVISGDFGPKAKELLDKLNIQMVVIPNEDTTVQNIINKLSK